MVRWSRLTTKLDFTRNQLASCISCANPLKFGGHQLITHLFEQPRHAATLSSVSLHNLPTDGRCRAPVLAAP